MIIFFNNQPVTEQVKIQKLIQRAQDLYGSEFFNIQDTFWFGDNLSVDALFPSWILTEHNANPSNVLIVPIIKNYLRWLLSLEYGYGAQLNWENLRSPLFCNSIFLEAYADYHFPYADFSKEPLSTILPNIRKFLTNDEIDYFSQKGTPQAVKYLMCNLLGFGWLEVDVYTANAGVMQIDVSSTKITELNKFKNFLEEHVFPAGITVIYGVI